MSPSSKSATPWISIKLGRALNAINITVPSCPNSSTDVHEKAHTYDAVTQVISAHLDTFDFAELSGCLSSHIPGQHVFLFHQIRDIHEALEHAPFSVPNIAPACYLTINKVPVEPTTVHVPVPNRPVNIAYFKVTFKVDPSTFAPSGITLTGIEPFAAEQTLDRPNNLPNHLPRANLWPNNTPGPQRPFGPAGIRLGHTIQRFAYNAQPTVLAAPTPKPPPPVDTPVPHQ